MRIRVKVIAHASRDAIEDLGNGAYKVWVRAIPERGKANQAVAKILSQEFGVPVRQVVLVSGQASSQKVFEILEM